MGNPFFGWGIPSQREGIRKSMDILEIKQYDIKKFVSSMIFGLGKFLRRFWKAYCGYFPIVIFSPPLTAVFGSRIVMKLPFFEF